MLLLVVRHGESLRNVYMKEALYVEGQEKLNIPNRSIPLTKQGELQARLAGRKIKALLDTSKKPLPKLLIHSGYLRAKATLEILVEELYKDSSTSVPKMRQNHLLRERDAGYCFDMNKKEADKHFPYRETHWGFEGKIFATPPGGESLVAVMDRVALFLNQLTCNPLHEDGVALAVSHGGTMKALRMIVEETPFDESLSAIPEPKNTEVQTYSYKNSTWTLE